MTWEEFCELVDGYCVITNKAEMWIEGVNFYFDKRGHGERVSGVPLEIWIAWGEYCKTLLDEEEK